MAPKDKQPQPTPEGERIAKLLSRRGIASRREAERLIEMGEVSVNGKVIASPALNVTDSDRIVVSGKPLPQAEPTRLWLYYKPEGLVTSAADEKGRDTVFDHLPEDMPRVMSVGRLDLNSEGLLLLTNDGELKRRLELPSTGWLRKYRVRVNGEVNDPKLQPLRDGITVEGERFKPMQVAIDRQQGANAWLTVGLREGRNREIRRAMAAVGLYVNRLIRVSYGPFRLGELEPGQVEEVKARVLRDQLGETGSDSEPDPRAPAKAPARKAAAKPGSRAVTKSGAGVEALSTAWKEATTPRPGPRVKPRAAAPNAAKPATGARTASGTRPDEAAAPRGGSAARTGGKAASPARASRPAPNDEAPPTRGGKPAPSARRGAAPAAGARPKPAAAPEPARGKTTRSAAPAKGKPAAKPAGKAAGGKPAPGESGAKPAPARPPRGGKAKRPPRSRA